MAFQFFDVGVGASEGAADSSLALFARGFLEESVDGRAGGAVSG